MPFSKTAKLNIVMSAAPGRIFLDVSSRKLRQLYKRIAECVDKLDEDEIWARGHDVENAVANLLLHLTGNLRQWVLSAIGGSPDTRQRDLEFATRSGLPKQDLLARLNRTVEEAIAVLESLPPERLTGTISPQGYQVTVLEGIYHVVEHFAQHTGQIIYATKMMSGQDLGFYRHLSGPAGHSEKTP